MSKNFLMIAMIFAASAFAQSGDATTTTVTRTSSYTFPLLALASTETVGVNLLNTAANSASGTASSCAGSVTFYNAAGTAIGSPSSFTLAANAATSVNLAFASSGLTGNRGLIRVVLATTTTSNVPCALSSTLNTFDTSSGVTHIFLVGANAVAQPTFSAPGH